MKAGAVRKLSGPEQRALREQITAADPAAEAWAHESSFLRSLATAQEDFDWIVANEAWTLIGHETFSAWWDARAPRMNALGFQPTKQIALAVLTRLRSDDEKLPKAQRRTNRQLAASVGLPETTMRRIAPRSLPAPSGAAADLGQSADVEATAEPETAASVGAGVRMPAARPAESPCSDAPDRAHCAAADCGADLSGNEQAAGHLRCRSCDPLTQHRAEGLGFDEGWGECTGCRLVTIWTSAAVPAGNTEDAPALGEPDVDVEAASTSGTKDSEENFSDGEDAQPRVDPVAGSESVRTGLGAGFASTEGGTHGGLSDPAGAAAPALATEDSPTGAVLAAPVPVGAAQELQDGIEEGIGCDRCDFSLLVSSVDPDASLTEMRFHLRREHDLYGDAAGLALARVRTISPAAVSESDPTNQLASLQQSGPDSPTGREGDRSETDFPVESPDLSRLPVGELEDGGERALTPSSSDPREEPTATDRLLYAMSELAKYLRSVDVEALAPTLFPNELVALHAHADEVAAFAGRIERARMALTGGQA